MSIHLPIDIDSIKGFLAADEGEALFNFALKSAALGPCLEIGSYCGKSTVYLGMACRERHNTLFSLDHHRGSEEHQQGEQYHDAELYDPISGKMDSFPSFRQTLAAAELEQTVVPIVSPSATVARHWATPLSMVFIDGGHSLESALSDYRCWAHHIKPGGILAIHDIFPDPTLGGQAPYHIWQLAQASGLFECLPTVNTLGLLRRSVE